MKLETLSRNVHRFSKDLKLSGTARFLLISDVHFDSTHCDRELLSKHLNEAKKENAGIICVGDFFDLMGGNSDPRSIPNDRRPEYNRSGESYFDIVIRDAYEYLKPYKDNLLLFGYGNHETSVLKHHERDVLENLTFMLNMNGIEVEKGGYSGFVVFKFSRYQGNNQTKVLYYRHGSGGNSKRSKGVLNVDLDAATVPDADIIVHGHTHQKWLVPSKVRMRLNRDYKIYQSAQQHLCLGTYKNEVEDGHGGWAVEKGFDPSKLGGWWVEFQMVNREVQMKIWEAV